ncbi:hypothetical protein [Nesterenkonia halotolerans]|uniref:DUF2721 domain-containing protein n=1 Tax=Nesterenkonia halotolerans TaxID=225325 RepID=A0ABR9JBM7_9MICC|nr:hypothetical protein [Nesterenkonia halotolerans]MBE1515951.1 hypothetical protein [Nesterenkonia halotolerans]
MNIDTTAIITAAIGPSLGFIGVLLRSFLGDRSYRRIKRIAELHEKLPTSVQTASEPLLLNLVDVYAKRAQKKLDRQVDGYSIVTLVVVGFLGGAATYFLVVWAEIAGGGWGILLYSIAIGVAIFIFLLMLVGLSQIFVYPGDKNYKEQ